MHGSSHSLSYRSWCQHSKSEVSHAVAYQMCLNVANLRLECVYTCLYPLGIMNLFAYLAMQVHAQCTRDNMTAYVSQQPLLLHVL